MRMRKKKNLDARLQNVQAILTVYQSENKNFSCTQPEQLLDLDRLFAKPQPVFIEIGCGKGGFARKFAALHPEINFLAIEKSANVLVEACEKALPLQLPNLRFLNAQAEYLSRIIPPHSVERIFLNFSCPFPKKSYASHRLTSARFLSVYQTILKPDGEIHQKTDNAMRFAFSLEQLSQNGFMLQNISLDLHHSAIDDNIPTEYEEKFAAMGLPIYYLEAKRAKT